MWIEIIHENYIPDYIIIDSNIFLDRKKGNGNGFETIRFGNSKTSLSQSYSIIENNIFENCNGEIEIISNKCGGNIYYKNTFKTSYGSLTLRHGNKVLVVQNKFLQNKLLNGGGVRVASGSGHIIYNNLFKNTNNRAALIINSGSNDDIYNIQVSYSKFLKNIFLNCSIDISIGSIEFPIPPRLCLIKNNYIIKNNNDPVYQINSNFLKFDFQNNIYKVNNMGNIPDYYYQQIYKNDIVEEVIIEDYGANEQEKIGYENNIIFDNKYGDVYYKYLNQTIFDEISLTKDFLGYKSIYNTNYILHNSSLDSSSSSICNLNPFILLIYFFFSYFNI